MERLTDKKEADVQRRKYEIRLKHGYPRNIPEERFLRLAAYEDTGLEPEDFKKAFNEDSLLKLTGQLLGVTPDRLRELAQADKEGRCVVLPGGGYKDKDGENALKSAMNTCFYHNNPVTRFIADAVAEKLTRDEAALRRDQE